MTKLVVRPVQVAVRPSYPTRLEVEATPGLLERHLPPGWRRVRELATAGTALLAAAMPACGSRGGARAAVGTARVAPIFEHGDGVAATGCVVVAPPVFLSEEEALTTIADELQRAGVRVLERGGSVPGVTFRRRESRPPTASKNCDADNRCWEEVGEELAVDFDLRSPKPPLHVEYVGAGDRIRLQPVEPCCSSVEEYKIRESAEYLAKRIGASDAPGYFGVFYDPAVHMSRAQRDSGRTGHRQLEEESRELLRAQVRDFVDWLKGQGVI